MNLFLLISLCMTLSLTAAELNQPDEALIGLDTGEWVLSSGEKLTDQQILQLAHRRGIQTQTRRRRINRDATTAATTAATSAEAAVSAANDATSDALSTISGSDLLAILKLVNNNVVAGQTQSTQAVNASTASTSSSDTWKTIITSGITSLTTIIVILITTYAGNGSSSTCAPTGSPS